MRFIKKAIPIFFLTLLVSCYGGFGGTSYNSNLPKWYLNPPKNDLSYLYGVGEGYNVDNASKSALNNLATKLMVMVSSTSELTRKENTFDYVEESDQKIKGEVPDLTFNNYEVVNNEYVDGLVYVVVAVNRPQFIQDNSVELQKIDSRIDNFDKNSQEKHILVRRQALVKINELSKESIKIAKILNGLTNSSEFTKNEAKYSEYAQELDVINDKMVFYIKTQSIPTEFVDVLRNKITSSEGIKVTDNKQNVSSKNLVILNAKSTSITKEIYGTVNTKFSIYLSLEDISGNILGSKQIEVSGSSLINKEQAINSASASLENMLKDEKLIEFIQNK